MLPSLLVVDDHAGFRGFVTALLAAEGFPIVGDAADGESALRRCAVLRPELVLLDVQLPGIDGFEVAQRLARQAHPPAVILTSTRDARDYGERLRTAPVVGFLPKQDISGAALAALLPGSHGRAGYGG